ncbi:MAG TPA: AAA family ATPase [Gemmataceae bacterium]|nr:AAA family ATPase [Gemmataceae bacterium]
MELGKLIEALSQPAAYPFAVAPVQVAQTHISVVFLAGSFAYKIKKPVQPGFLDFSTLEKRQFYCEEEVRLNRRLAPDVYLGVVPVTARDDTVQFEGPGPAVEWAVKMVRLPDEATLHAQLERDEGSVAQAELLARRIAEFHRNAPPAAIAADFAAVSRNVLDVLDRGEWQASGKATRTIHQRLRQLTEERLSQLRPLVETRAMRGTTRDCHGDLHLDHVYYFPDRPPPGDLVIVDCIEFNGRFRFIDPVADMAFAAMDFTYHGRRDLARVFSEVYFRETGDQEGRDLLELYTSYRAAVRAAVDRMKAEEPEVSPDERRRAWESVQRHELLALGQLESASKRPCLLLVGGLPGSGKSTLARALADRAGFEVIRSDVVRKQLAEGPGKPGPGNSLYSEDWHRHTYGACLATTVQWLGAGKRVLVDATFRRERDRHSFLAAARRTCVPAGLLICQARPPVVQARLAQRRGDVSDADWQVYLATAREWEAIGLETDALMRTINTEGSESEVTPRALAALIELGLWENR